MNSNFYITIYLMLLISLGYIVTDIYLPSLPALTVYFQASENEVQMTLFSYLLSFALCPLIFGPLSDHIGRKKVILGGVLISLLATLGCLFAQNILWLIISRFFQGLGTGAVLIATRATVSDLFTGKALAKQMSLVTMLMPLLLAIAPTIGGFLQEKFQWQANFIFVLFYLIVVLICVLMKTESLKKPSHEKISHIFATYRSHLSNTLFLVYGVNFVLPSLGLFSYLTVSPFLFQEMIGLSPVEYGSLALYVGATILVTGYINLKLIKHFEVNKILFFGGSLILFAGCLLAFFHFLGILTTWSLLIPSLLFFTCMPLCIANAASKSMSLVHGNFGTATALLSSFQFLIGALGSLIFSLIPQETALSLGICFICIGVLFLVNLQFASKLEIASSN